MEIEQTIAIIFIIVGVILLMAEAFSPGAFMVIPGTVLVILGIIAYAFPDTLFSIYSPIIALAVAIPVTYGTVKLYQVLAKPEPPTTTMTESLVGKEGFVTVRTVPENIIGKVRIDSDVWSARSEEPIEAGTAVVVVRSQGVHVTVKKK